MIAFALVILVSIFYYQEVGKVKIVLFLFGA